MATEVIMPKLGATMEGATILQWYKGEGEPVQKGEPILEVQTDKINIDVEAEASGVLLKQVYEAEAEVPVNTVIAYIGQAGEAVGGDPARSTATVNSETATVSTAAALQTGSGAEQTVSVSAIVGRPRATPSARRLAKLYGVDLLAVQGSGPHNRIQKVDVEQFVAVRQGDEPARAPAASTPTPAGVPRFSATVEQAQGTTESALPMPREATRIPVTGVRKVVGQRMASSAFSAPHVTLTSEVNAKEVVSLRNRLLPVIEAQTGHRLSYTEVIILAVARALRRNPMLNASYQGEYIEVYENVHVGMAVAVPNGLVVPVVRNADQKGLLQIVQECKQLAQAARENRLKLDQLSGGTFTVSNLGMYRVEAFTPIINMGETAILGVGRLVEKPVVVAGSVEVGPMLTLSLSFDHRVVDGAPAAQFLTDLCYLLEQPEQLIL
ncbi:dihydrolipoamide acetyltransferase family protein [Alicyclobacillus sp. ALC3]|uniref:dihydrolipoamide acetyltransferase family protein n=1 Tax=Alicyclobacillus sp. ALC3 TaxID=2796143 RepID=UPI002379C798|nr:dihydrolipoamide acetyltransferase family protein [Alicyclobacillus sp. ALC3]WDL97583.1 2-oxo acid dehydrogenase subunit E2 [Alicyclobacillus sp. ALC3]